jgi:hypothetical protein
MVTILTTTKSFLKDNNKKLDHCRKKYVFLHVNKIAQILRKVFLNFQLTSKALHSYHVLAPVLGLGIFANKL